MGLRAQGGGGTERAGSAPSQVLLTNRPLTTGGCHLLTDHHIRHKFKIHHFYYHKTKHLLQNNFDNVCVKSRFSGMNTAVGAFRRATLMPRNLEGVRHKSKLVIPGSHRWCRRGRVRRRHPIILHARLGTVALQNGHALPRVHVIHWKIKRSLKNDRNCSRRMYFSTF